jgi:hypothetical protein
MSQERLSALGILSIERDETEKLCVASISTAFVETLNI